MLFGLDGVEVGLIIVFLTLFWYKKSIIFKSNQNRVLVYSHIHPTSFFGTC